MKDLSFERLNATDEVRRWWTERPDDELVQVLIESRDGLMKLAQTVTQRAILLPVAEAIEEAAVRIERRSQTVDLVLCRRCAHLEEDDDVGRHCRARGLVNPAETYCPDFRADMDEEPAHGR